jgi:hypothetical protein
MLPRCLRRSYRPAVTFAPATNSAWDTSLWPSGPVVFTNGGATAENGPVGNEGAHRVLGTQAIVGKKAVEFICVNTPINGNFDIVMARIGLSIAGLSATGDIGHDSGSLGLRGDGMIMANFAAISPADAGAAFTTGARIQMLVDTTSSPRKAWFSPDGVNYFGDGSGPDDPAAGTGGVNISYIGGAIFAACDVYTAGGGPSADKITLVTGSALLWTPPTGFSALA